MGTSIDKVESLKMGKTILAVAIRRGGQDDKFLKTWREFVLVNVICRIYFEIRERRKRRLESMHRVTPRLEPAPHKRKEFERLNFCSKIWYFP